MGAHQYDRYVSVITASGSASGSASGMNRACIGYASGYRSRDHPFSVKLGEGCCWGMPKNMSWRKIK